MNALTQMTQSEVITLGEIQSIFDDMQQKEKKRRLRISEVISGTRGRRGLEYLPVGLESDFEYQVMKIRLRKNPSESRSPVPIYCIFSDYMQEKNEVTLNRVSPRVKLYAIYSYSRLFSRRYMKIPVSRIESITFKKVFLKFKDIGHAYFIEKDGKEESFNVIKQAVPDYTEY